MIEIPFVFAAFIATVVGGMNERCAMILSNLLRSVTERMHADIHIPRNMTVSNVKIVDRTSSWWQFVAVVAPKVIITILLASATRPQALQLNWWI